VQVSNSSNWFARPSKATKLKAGQTLADCKASCLALINGGKKNCAAFSLRVVTSRAANTLYCDIYNDWVPERVCNVGDVKFNCKRGSQGSFRVRWVYT
jgi:hypothetical protein